MATVCWGPPPVHPLRASPREAGKKAKPKGLEQMGKDETEEEEKEGGGDEEAPWAKPYVITNVPSFAPLGSTRLRRHGTANY